MSRDRLLTTAKKRAEAEIGFRGVHLCISARRRRRAGRANTSSWNGCRRCTISWTSTGSFWGFARSPVPPSPLCLFSFFLHPLLCPVPSLSSPPHTFLFLFFSLFLSFSLSLSLFAFSSSYRSLFSLPVSLLARRVYMSTTLRTKVSGMPRSFTVFQTVFSSKEEQVGAESPKP